MKAVLASVLSHLGVTFFSSLRHFLLCNKQTEAKPPVMAQPPSCFSSLICFIYKAFLPRITRFFPKNGARRARRPHLCSALLCLVNLLQVCLCDSDSSDSTIYAGRASLHLRWRRAQRSTEGRVCTGWSSRTATAGPQLCHRRQQNESTYTFLPC